MGQHGCAYDGSFQSSRSQTHRGREMTDRELPWKTNENHYCLSKLMKSGTVLLYLFFDCMNLRAGLKGYLPCQVKPLNVSSCGALGLYNIMLMKFLGKDLQSQWERATILACDKWEMFKLHAVSETLAIFPLEFPRRGLVLFTLHKRGESIIFVYVTGLFCCCVDRGEWLLLLADS